ncbi:ligase-associated DNA damage response exonuclease [Aestuariivirga sp.]|jgi:putative mRNA 3-end processing factor|uniref:ligase-associated DNA damage response exonuclease n=1 Tax=Aestuariivirga sp. TaxID=2650926 RepID=UPI0037837242
MTSFSSFQSWLRPDQNGLYCEPGGFYVDPLRPVDRAVITHGHSDHARPGHAAVLATVDTLAIMRLRLGSGCFGQGQALSYNEALRLGDVSIRLVPAGHILGSAQVVIEHRGQRAVISGDYKRRADPTCAPFEPVSCDLFVTEATFGLPVYRHEPDQGEVAKLFTSLADFPGRTHQIGVYGLGKCQRLIALLRQQGYDRPVYLHGALRAVTDYYVSRGIDLGPAPAVADAPGKLAGEIVLSPPSALGDRWSRRFSDPLAGFASGWMRIRGRVRQRGVELPLIISDHADWPELLATVGDTGAGEVWVTHGREDALVHELAKRGIAARALRLVGREDDAE